MPDTSNVKRHYKKLLSNILLFLSVTTLISIAGYNIIAIKSSYQVYNDNQQNVCKQQTENFTRQLDNIMNYKQNMITSFSENEFILNFVQETASAQSADEIKSSKNYEYVLSSLKYLQNIDSSFGYTWISFDNDNFILTNEGNLSNDMLSKQPIYSDIIFNTSDFSAWTSYQIKSSINNNDMITIISPIKDSNDNVIGYIGADIFSDQFTAIIESIKVSNSYHPYITDSKGNVLYEKNSEFLNVNDPAVQSIKSDVLLYEPKSVSLFTTQDNEKQYVINEVSSNSQFHILMFTDSHYFNNIFTHNSIKNLLSLIGSLILLLIIPLSFYIKHLLKDTNKICSAVDCINNGDYSYKINSQSKTEIGKIADSIDYLSDVFQNKIGKLEKIAWYDNITELPNHHKLSYIIDEYIKKAEQNKSNFAIIYFDIDNFKWLNDSFGKEFCDNLLLVFSQKLKANFEKIAIVGRPRSDTFIVVMEYKDTSEIDNAIQRLRVSLLHRIAYNNNDTYLKFSTGISTYPECGNTAELLLRNANIATDYIKKHGKNSTCYYTDDMFHSVNRQILIEKLLNTAINNNEFYLHYQPIFNQSTKEIVAVEVFIRWYNNILGNIEPTEFLPIAEKNGCISTIMDWVFNEAFLFQKKVCEACSRNDIIVSINIASTQPKQGSFIDNMKAKIEKSGINPRCLQLEISESIMRDLVEHNCFSTNELFAMGVNIAFDQYGIGCSSPSYMNYFRVTCLKIDRSMVHKLPKSPHDIDIVGSVIKLCHKFNNKVSGTGIETEEQLATMLSLNADYIQGNFLCKPLSESEVLQFCKTYQSERDKENGFY